MVCEGVERKHRTLQCEHRGTQSDSIWEQLERSGRWPEGRSTLKLETSC